MSYYYKLCEKQITKKFSGDERRMRDAWGTAGSVTGIVVNFVLAGIKLIAGLISGSVAAIADAANNLSDAGGSFVSLLSVRLSSRRETRNNPFGFGRMEYLGTLFVGMIILFMGVELFKSGIDSILQPQAIVFSVFTLIMLCVSVLGKLWLYFIYRKIALPIHSSTLMAAAKDSLSDCISTLAVILSMLVSYFFGIKIDCVVGLLVSLLVLKAGWDVLSDTVSQLLGGKPDKELGERIIERVMQYEYVQGVHDFVMHDYGPGRCMASIHVEVPAGGDLVAMHEVIDRMERDIDEELHVPICVHLDPVKTLTAEERAVEQALVDFLSSYNPPLKMHDFRIVPGQKRINLIFDIVTPPGFKNEEKLLDEISAHMRSIDERYVCVTHCDKDYYNV